VTETKFGNQADRNKSHGYHVTPERGVVKSCNLVKFLGAQRYPRNSWSL